MGAKHMYKITLPHVDLWSFEKQGTSALLS